MQTKAKKQRGLSALAQKEGLGQRPSYVRGGNTPAEGNTAISVARPQNVNQGKKKDRMRPKNNRREGGEILKEFNHSVWSKKHSKKPSRAAYGRRSQKLEGTIGKKSVLEGIPNRWNCNRSGGLGDKSKRIAGDIV